MEPKLRKINIQNFLKENFEQIFKNQENCSSSASFVNELKKKFSRFFRILFIMEHPENGTSKHFDCFIDKKLQFWHGRNRRFLPFQNKHIEVFLRFKILRQSPIKLVRSCLKQLVIPSKMLCLNLIVFSHNRRFWILIVEGKSKNVFFLRTDEFYV